MWVCVCVYAPLRRPTITKAVGETIKLWDSERDRKLTDIQQREPIRRIQSLHHRPVCVKPRLNLHSSSHICTQNNYSQLVKCLIWCSLTYTRGRSMKNTPAIDFWSGVDFAVYSSQDQTTLTGMGLTDISSNQWQFVFLTWHSGRQNLNFSTIIPTLQKQFVEKC